MQNQSEMRQEGLDEQILDRVRQAPRTQDELVKEVSEAKSRVRSRLQFLDGAGYVEQNEETGKYELRKDPDDTHLFEERPRLRWVVFGAVLLASEIPYYYFLDVVLEDMLVGVIPPIVALIFSLPFAWMTARIAVSPRIMGRGPGYRMRSPGK